MSKKWKCPHCGSEEYICGYYSSTNEEWRTYCEACDSRGPWRKTEKAARRSFCKPAAFKAKMKAKRQRITGPDPEISIVVDYLWKVADTYAEESTHKRVWNLAPVSDEEPPF